jgi:hypothetical protein
VIWPEAFLHDHDSSPVKSLRLVARGRVRSYGQPFGTLVYGDSKLPLRALSRDRKRDKLPHSKRGHDASAAFPTSHSLLVEQAGSVDAFTFVDDLGNTFRGRDVFEGIAVYQHKVSIAAFLDGADAAVCPQ